MRKNKLIILTFVILVTFFIFGISKNSNAANASIQKNNIMFIGEIDGKAINLNELTYTNKNMTIIAMSSGGLTDYKVLTSKNGQQWYDEKSQEFTSNGTMYVKLSNGTNNYYATINITNIDKDAPTLDTTPKFLGSANSIIADIPATDGDGSGISSYAIIYQSFTARHPTYTNDIDWNNKIISNLETNKKYTIRAVKLTDKAGNISYYPDTFDNVLLNSGNGYQDIIVATTEYGKEEGSPDLTPDNINFSYQIDNHYAGRLTYTNKEVKVTASTENIELGNYKIQTSKDATLWSDENNQTFSENGVMYVRLINGNKIGGVASIVITNIDKEAPKVTYDSTFIGGSNCFIVNIPATDEKGSGIKSYSVLYETPNSKTLTETDDIAWDNKIVTGLNANTQYKIKAIKLTDNAGNVTESPATFNECRANSDKGFINKIVTTTDNISESNVPLLTKDNFKLEYESNGKTIDKDTWTNQDVTIKVSTTLQGHIIKTSQEKYKWESKDSQTFTKNGTLFITLDDEYVNENILEIQITNIDKDAPKLNAQPSFTGGPSCINANISATDGQGSGIKSYAILYEDNFMRHPTITSDIPWNNKKITGLQPNTQYKIKSIKLTDNVGNEAYCSYTLEELQSNNQIGLNISVTTTDNNVETEVPELDINNTTFTYKANGQTIDSNTWTNQDVTVTASITNVEELNQYTIQTSKEGQNWSNTAEQTFSENGTMYVRLWDGTKGGFSTTVEVNNIDKTGPTITTLEADKTEKTNENVVITAKAKDEESGIVAYGWTTNPYEPGTTPTSKWIDIESTTEEITQTNELGANGILFFWVKDAAGNKKNRQITVTNIDKTPADPNITSEKYNIENGNITNISPDTTVKNIKDNLTSSKEYTIVDKDGNELEEGDLVGTGSKLHLQTGENYNVVVNGDINGDGKITLTDLAKIKRELIDLENLNGPYKLASDLNNDKETTLTDLAIIKKIIIGLIKL